MLIKKEPEILITLVLHKAIVLRKLKVVVCLLFGVFAPLPQCYSQNSNNTEYLTISVLQLKDIETKKVRINKVNDSLRKLNLYKERYSFLTALTDTFKRKKEFQLEVISVNSLGNLYNSIGKYSEAINVFNNLRLELEKASLEKNEKHNLLSLTFLNTGNSYFYLNDVEKALLFYKKSLGEMKKKNKKDAIDDERIAQIFNNIGIAYGQKNDYQSGLFYFKRALYIDLELKDSSHIANVLSNIATVFAETNQTDSALFYYNKVKSIYEKVGGYDDLAFINNELSDLYFKQKKYKEALNYSKKALNFLDTNAYTQELINAYKNLYNIYSKTKDYKNELKYFKLHSVIEDSLKKSDILNKLNTKEIQIEFTKIHLTDSVIYANKLQTRDLKIAKDQQNRFYLILIIIIILIALGLIYNRFKITKKQNLIIEQQKTEVEEQKSEVERKNKEVIESITYAKRLQDAILPSENELNSAFKESFILYKPKDIVAGDFYWMHHVKSESNNNNNLVLIAAADCTGHGVPGAMISIACHNALNRTIDEFKVTSTGEVLDTVKKLITENFNKNETTIRDGMDISLLAISYRTNTVEWSGANNRLLYVHNNDLLEIKSDKQPVSYSDKNEKFTTHILPLQKGDIFYLFTDGILDQFGGEKNKKFGIANFKKLIESNKNKPLNEQGLAIEKAFNDWKKHHEQIDDVTVLAVKI